MPLLSFVLCYLSWFKANYKFKITMMLNRWYNCNAEARIFFYHKMKLHLMSQKHSSKKRDKVKHNASTSLCHNVKDLCLEYTNSKMAFLRLTYAKVEMLLCMHSHKFQFQLLQSVNALGNRHSSLFIVNGLK